MYAENVIKTLSAIYSTCLRINYIFAALQMMMNDVWQKQHSLISGSMIMTCKRHQNWEFYSLISASTNITCKASKPGIMFQMDITGGILMVLKRYKIKHRIKWLLVFCVM